MPRGTTLPTTHGLKLVQLVQISITFAPINRGAGVEVIKRFLATGFLSQSDEILP